MSLFRCPKCELPITDTEINAGVCACGFSLAVHGATLSVQPTSKPKNEYSPVFFNTVLLAGIVVFLLGLSYALWALTEKYDAEPQPAVKAPK